MQIQLPHDVAYNRENRQAHRRLANSVLKILHSVWSAVGQLYHRARYPPYKPLELRSRRRCSQSQSKLLMLPPEIRFIIWDYVMASGPIALYQTRDRITYDLMPEHIPKSVINITPQTLREAIQGRTSRKASKRYKPSFLPVLQTCQMIYLETLICLYQKNTFVCLHNTAPIDFCKSALPQHLSLIHSFHIHFQFREMFYNGFSPMLRGDPDPYNVETLSLVCKHVHQSMPNLRTLSIFLQGPITQPETYEQISCCLKRMRCELKDLRMMAVRFPRLTVDSWVASLPAREREYHQIVTDGHLVSMGDYFHVLQPPVGDGQQDWEIADLDTKDEKGWRLGTMYQVRSPGLDGLEMRNYAILTDADDVDSDKARREL